MAQYVWPPITTANPSVSGTGAAAPSSATEVGGVDGSGNLRALSTTSGGVLNVNVSSTTTSPLPVTDAAAETSLSSIDSKFPAKGQAAMAASVPVAIASNQSAIPVQGQYEPINSAGSHTTGTVSTVITLTAPANAIGFILEAKDSNTANMRWAIGATATTTVGMQLQAGRDTGFVPAGANVSIVSESGTQEYQMQWVLTH